MYRFFDTAGRTQIDLQMMSEIKEIERVIKPSEVLLVADSLTGQVAANVAKEFKNTVNVTGIVLTRSDGDGRGGAALSMKHLRKKKKQKHLRKKKNKICLSQEYLLCIQNYFLVHLDVVCLVRD